MDQVMKRYIMKHVTKALKLNSIRGNASNMQVMLNDLDRKRFDMLQIVDVELAPVVKGTDAEKAIKKLREHLLQLTRMLKG